MHEVPDVHVCSGSISVSSCRCWVLVSSKSSVQTVEVRNVVFCIVCSLVMFVADVIGIIKVKYTLLLVLLPL